MVHSIAHSPTHLRSPEETGAIPDYQSLMLPLLRRSAIGPRPIRDLITELSEEFELSEAQRNEKLPSGGTTVIASRTHWAKTYLKNAGLLTQPARGVVQITEAGRKLLASSPLQVDNQILSNFASFREFKARARASQTHDVEADKPLIQSGGLSSTPDEQIARAFLEYDVALRADLQARILTAPPVSWRRWSSISCSRWATEARGRMRASDSGALAMAASTG